MPEVTSRDGGRHTADFFGAQQDARFRSALLLLYFNATVAAMIVSFYLLAAFFVIPPRDVKERIRLHGTSLIDNIDGWLPTGYLAISHEPWNRRWWQAELFFPVAAAVALMIYGTAAWRLASLRRLGGRGIAEALGATLLNRRSPNLADLQFWNTIEEMALSAEMPMPAAYVLERETGINAFATGHGPKDAAIGITRGALNLLNRSEIQGIVAHEFSHVVNGDMRLNTRLVGMLHGLVFIADAGERIAEIGLGGEAETNDRPAGPAFVVIGNAVQLLGSMGVLLAQIIKAAICRQREYLADAAALQYTRDPSTIGGALRKIAAISGGGIIRAAGRTAISHVFFCNALRGWGRGLLATHPDIFDRILAVDPAWNGELPTIDTNRLPSPPPTRIGEIAVDPDRGRSIEDRMGVELARVLALNATPVQSPADDPLVAASKTTDGAPALILSMLLPRNARDRQRALRNAPAGLTHTWIQEAARLSHLLENISGPEKLKLASDAIAAMCIMPSEAFRMFETAAARLVTADKDIDLFEYALDMLLQRHLAPYFRHPVRPKVDFQSTDQLVGEAITLLSIVARADPRLGPAECEAAFRAGLRPLRLYSEIPGIRAPKACGLGALHGCIEKFHRAADYVREDMLAACQATATAHGTPSDDQTVLLRVISIGTECHSQPLPS